MNVLNLWSAFLVMLLCCFSIVVLTKVKQKEETSIFQTQIQQERSRAGGSMEALHSETYSLSTHEATAGVCKPEEWRKPGIIIAF